MSRTETPESQLWPYLPGLSWTRSLAKADRLNTQPPESVHEKRVTLYRPKNAIAGLPKLIDGAERRIQGIVDEIRLKNPTSPPAANPGKNESGPPGIGLTLEECRDNARKVEADAARLHGHAAKLATICASSAEVVRSVPKQIDGEVATLNATLQAFERGNGQPPTTRGDVVNAIFTCLDNIENSVKIAHERQKGLAEQVARLERDAAVAKDANSDRKPPGKKADSSETKAESPEKKVADAGREKSTGDGDGDRPPATSQRHLKSDRLAGNESEQADRESTDPQGLRAQLADLAKRLEGRDGESDRDEQPTQHGSAPQSSQSSWLEKLAPVFAIGAMATTPLVGLATALAQQRPQEHKRDLASADAPPDGKTPPGTPPGAPPNGSVSVQPVKLEEAKTGDFTVDGPLIKLPDGRLEILGPDGKQLPFDPNIPPNRGIFRASPVQVAAAAAPPTPVA